MLYSFPFRLFSDDTCHFLLNFSPSLPLFSPNISSFFRLLFPYILLSRIFYSLPVLLLSPVNLSAPWHVVYVRHVYFCHPYFDKVNFHSQETTSILSSYEELNVSLYQHVLVHRTVWFSFLWLESLLHLPSTKYMFHLPYVHLFCWSKYLTEDLIYKGR